MKRITEIAIKTEPDNDPDLSYLGEISNKQTYNKHWIPIDPKNLNAGWFSPGNHLPYNPKSDLTRKEAIKYAYRDLDRLQRYGRDWWMEGVIVTAKIEVSEDGKNWAHEEVIASLWGIESDMDKTNIIEDLKSEVAHDLKIWGFTNDEISEAMKLIKEEKQC